MHIAMQKHIELNQLNSNQLIDSDQESPVEGVVSQAQVNKPLTLPDATVNNGVPVATSSPKAKINDPPEYNSEMDTPCVSDATKTLGENGSLLLPDVTTDLPDVASGNKDTAAPVAPENNKSGDNQKNTNTGKSNTGKGDATANEWSASGTKKSKSSAHV